MPARNILNDFAVYAFHGMRCYDHVTFAQVHKPGEFGSDGRLVVIALAVNPQGPFAPISSLHAICGVFREVDHRHRNFGGQGVMLHRFFSDLLKHFKH